MRELIFRAWNKYHQKMYPVYMLNFESYLVYCKGDDYSGHTFGKIDCEIMQFTGIRDKNGVKIFEGDIVDDHIGSGVVEFSDNYGAFKVNYKNGIGKWFIDYSLRGERESIEVIGNIIQHPHLLEQKK